MSEIVSRFEQQKFLKSTLKFSVIIIILAAIYITGLIKYIQSLPENPLDQIWKLSESIVAEKTGEPLAEVQTEVNTEAGTEDEAATSQPANTNTTSARVTRIIDGDTIQLDGGQTVRYIGIDTPETYGREDCFGQEATEKNRELVSGKVVVLEKDVSETDRYGRLLRYVYIGDIFVNDALVKEGYAFAASFPPDIKHQDTFRESESYARENNLGLWGVTCL